MGFLGTVVYISTVLLLSFAPTILPMIDNESPELLWEFKADNVVMRTPATGDGLVYFSCYEGPLYALDALTGKVLWKHESGTSLFSSIVHMNVSVR